MVQEIVTYIIVAAAVAWAGYKIFLKFSRKKPKNELRDKAPSNVTQHQCDDCIAECILRDTVKPGNVNEESLCKKIDIR